MSLNTSTAEREMSKKEVTYRDIQHLAPFKDVRDNLSTSIASNAHLVKLNAGSTEIPRDGKVYFLAAGILQFSVPGVQQRSISAKDPAATIPLPQDPKWHVKSPSGALLIQVPKRYLDLGEDHLHQESAESSDLTGCSIAGELYLQFFETLKKGKVDLPGLPDTMIKIGDAIDSDSTSNNDIANLIQTDPALTARLISIVNSAAYGRSVKINSLSQAIGTLGRKRVRNLVFSSIVKNLFVSKSPFLKQHLTDLWQRSCKIAAISFVLADITPGLDPDRAMLCALMHDIGVIPIVTAANKQPDLKDDAEKFNLLLNEMKGEIGALTLRSWGLDSEIAEVASNANNWWRLGTALADYLDVILIARLHAAASDGVQGDYPILDSIPAFQKLALGKLTPHKSIAVLEDARQKIEELESLLIG